jgi:transposase
MMVKGTMNTRINAIASWKSGRYSTAKISQMYDVSERTIRLWKTSYEKGGFESLKPQSTAPRRVKTVPKTQQSRIIRLKERYPMWGAKRSYSIAKGIIVPNVKIGIKIV